MGQVFVLIINLSLLERVAALTYTCLLMMIFTREKIEKTCQNKEGNFHFSEKIRLSK